MINHSERDHALLSPSSAKRWVNCPASVRFIEGLNLPPEEEYIYAREGTVAHEIAEMTIRNALYGYNQSIGYDTDEEFDISEMVSNAQKYRDYIQNSIIKITSIRNHVFIEERVYLDNIIPESFGSLDFGCILPDFKEIHICDYKYGKGVPVSAVDNEQLLCYTIGFLQLLSVNNIPYDSSYSLHMHIFQPRNQHVNQKHAITFTELMDKLDNISAQAKLAYKGYGPFNPGDHCTFCRAAGVCVTLANCAIKNYTEEDPNRMTEDQIVSILEVESMLKSWLKKVKDFATIKAIQENKPPKGFKLVDSYSKRVWTSTKVVEELANHIGIKDDIYKMQLRTVADVQKRITPEQFKALSGCIKKDTSGLTLAPETDRRIRSSKRDIKEQFKDFKL